jgi:hypothetical protein
MKTSSEEHTPSPPPSSPIFLFRRQGYPFVCIVFLVLLIFGWEETSLFQHLNERVSSSSSEQLVSKESSSASLASSSVPLKSCSDRILLSIENKQEFDHYVHSFLHPETILVHELNRTFDNETNLLESKKTKKELPQKMICTQYSHLMTPMKKDAILFVRSRSRPSSSLLRGGNVPFIKPLVFDGFMLHSEVHLALLRMETLKHVVDYFVLVESNSTFTGVPKSLSFAENRQKFHDFQDKLIYVSFAFPPWDEKQNEMSQTWKREAFSRDVLLETVLARSKNPEDLLLFSDVDEIPNPFFIRFVRDCDLFFSIIPKKEEQLYMKSSRFSSSSSSSSTPLVPLSRWQDEIEDGICTTQTQFHADLACRSRTLRAWAGTKIHTAKQARQIGTGQQIRHFRQDKCVFHAPRVGWHVSNTPFGDASFLSAKFNSYSRATHTGNKPLQSVSNGEWAKQVVEGFPSWPLFVCDRKETEFDAPTGAFANINAFGPFLSRAQRLFGTYLYETICT